MKIVFLCGTLEPGRDGVGDYTRRLAAELIRQGHISVALSLNDKYISDKFDGVQQSEGVDLPVLRLASALPMNTRHSLAKKYIDDFNPDWISLQFVIYTFHKKGLPLGVSKFLYNLGKNRQWHIMFHEIWIGIHVGSSKAHFVIGRIQKRIIKNLVRVLKPSVIHTQTRFYQDQLTNMGFSCGYLPLFSNIPVLHAPENKKKQELNTIKLVIFGTIHPNSPINDFALEAADYSKKRRVKIVFVFIGKCGNEQANWVSVCKSNGFEVVIMGEQSPETVSAVLTGSDIGVSSNDIPRVDKSGTVAAMLEHGLPVVCVSNPWVPRGTSGLKLSPPAGIIQYERGNIEVCLKTRENRARVSNLEITSSLLVADLSKKEIIVK